MMCPILAPHEVVAAEIRKENINVKNTNCIEGLCAWWDENGQCCALCTIASALRKLSKR